MAKYFMTLPFKIAMLMFILTIVAYFLVRREQKKHFKSYNMIAIDKMSGIEFETMLKHVFRKMGYKVEETPKSNDYGADLILTRHGKKTVIQAKRYSNKVGISAVQQALSAQIFYDANESAVVTNSYFTNQAKKMALMGKVKLIDRDVLEVILSRLTND